MKGLNEYQEAALKTARFDNNLGAMYPVLGMMGEVGEVAEKVGRELFKEDILAINPNDRIVAEIHSKFGAFVKIGRESESLKKVLRDHQADLRPEWLESIKKRVQAANFDDEGIKKELGDVLWYLSVAADFMGWSLEEIAEANLAKLADRKARGVLKGSGDDR